MIIVSAAAAAEESRWRKLPLPPGRAETIRAIALEQNTLWALAHSGAFYWDGKQWNRPTGITLRGSMSATTLIGGGDRALYCTQVDHQSEICSLYRLSKEKLARVAEFPFSRLTGRPRLFIARSESLLHFMKEKLGVLIDGSWQYHDAPGSRFEIFEDDESTYVCFPLSNLMMQVSRRGYVRSYPLHLQLPTHPLKLQSLSRPTEIKFVRWGVDRVLVFQRGRPRPLIQCFELRTGEPVDVVSLEKEFQTLEIGNQFSTDDGSVWSLQSDDGAGPAFVKISADLKVSEPVRIEPKEFNLGRSPQSFLAAQDGSMWFGLKDSLATFDGKQLTFYKHNIGYDVSGCSLLEDDQGTIYANNGSIHVFYRFTDPPAELTPPVLAQLPLHTFWDFQAESRKSFGAAWMDDNTIYLTGAGMPLTAIQADSGTERFRQSLSPETRSLTANSVPWMVSRDERTLEITTSKELLRIDRSTGEIRSRQALAHDSRIAPIKIPEGSIVVGNYRGREMSAVDNTGTVRWRQSLPGYLMANPVVHGDRAVIQTRGSDYGGQATLCLDLRDGTILWNDRTDAYGSGAVISDDGNLIVECDDWLSPGGTEAWVIGRSIDGKRQWHYRDPEQRVSAPIIDPSTNYIYVMLSQGKVVCLDGRDGEIVWQRSLPEGLVRQGGASPYVGSWSPHSLQDGRLLVVDKSLTAHVLDTHTGESIVRVVLDPNPPVSSSRRPELIASPWITSNAIVSAFRHGVVAIPLPKELERVMSPQELPYRQLAFLPCAPHPVCLPSQATTCRVRSRSCFGQRLRNVLSGPRRRTWCRFR